MSSESENHLLREALKLHREGHLDQAEKLYRQVIGSAPEDFHGRRLLGMIEYQRGDFVAALGEIDAALNIDPNAPDALIIRGNILRKMNRLAEALVCFEQAAALKPEYAKAFYNCGSVLHEMKRFEDALASYDQAIALNSEYADALNARGNVLKEMNRLPEALSSYNLAIASNKRHADAHKNRGTVLQELWRIDEAILSYDQALAIRPDYAQAYNNRGSALHELKRLDEALLSYDRALALKPGFVNANINRGMTRLLTGHFREGLSELEWRLRTKKYRNERPTLDAPLWQGEDLAGKEIVVFAEQGLGDTIQFARFLPLLVDRGARVTCLLPKKLVRVLRHLASPHVELTGSIGVEKHFDFQCPLMSLPHKFEMELSSIPNGTPYLQAENELVLHWAQRLGRNGLKVGIVWQGNPNTRLDRGRSFPLTNFIPLARLGGVRLIALQRTYGLDQISQLPADVHIENLGETFDGGEDAFVDTAAIIANLDLVISSDTSVAHLAGAMGRPTWVALKYVPDWRWLLDREDSPWYPTMRLFRQQSDGDWQPVFSKIENALRLLQENVKSGADV